MRAASAPWTAPYSRTGTFDGLLPGLGYKKPCRELAGPAVLGAIVPCNKWKPYCIPVLDQGQSGMCQSFSSMLRLSVVLRAKLDYWFLTGEIESIADDLCLDPRPGHLLGREKMAPGEPYSHKEGLYAGTTIDVLREAGRVSPGTTNPSFEWRDAPLKIEQGPLEIPVVITDSYEPRNMSKYGELKWPVDPSALRGAHSMGCVMIAVSATEKVMLGVPNTWWPWGVDGYCWLSLDMAEWSAVDKPRVTLVSDIEWYRDNDVWRQLLCKKTELADWLRKAG